MKIQGLSYLPYCRAGKELPDEAIDLIYDRRRKELLIEEHPDFELI